MSSPPRVLLESYSPGRDGASYAFSGLVREIAATTPEEVVPALKELEQAVAEGYHAAGFVTYEASAGLANLPTLPPGKLPLLWFGIFRHRTPVTAGEHVREATEAATTDWTPSLGRDDYAAAIAAIRELIAAGATYQVNFTMRLSFRLDGDPLACYRDFCRSQQAPYCAWIDTGAFRILSASPELFFRLEGDRITTRPMKGTAARGRWLAEDEEACRALRANPKERAENLMIVDLLRNDLGMVAATGTVQAAPLFDVETFPTVHQMTSTVTARLKEGVGISDLFRALFPCGSVTGAPKRKTMEIIAGLESSPRGLYTGCIGYVSPGPEAVFSVAIRTAVIDSTTARGELGVGSGVTWDSTADDEYAECLAKASFAMAPQPEFHLIESLLLEQQEGYFLFERHLARLERSARYFGFRLDPAKARRLLCEFAATLTGTQKVRLLLGRDGSITLESAPVNPEETMPLPVTFAGITVDSSDPFLYHKTTRRELYAAELARNPHCVDVIFRNERGEVTEAANSNVVAKIGGKRLTPPLASGLLPGTFREELLESGILVERTLTAEDLAEAEAIFLINSVRKWRPAALVAPRFTTL
ncbi:MAG TPA: aminodeoxychorismate synthase component I [Geobacteraceae bacterium]